MVSHYVIMKSSVIHPRSDSRNWPRNSEWHQLIPEPKTQIGKTWSTGMDSLSYTQMPRQIPDMTFTFPASCCWVCIPGKVCIKNAILLEVPLSCLVFRAGCGIRLFRFLSIVFLSTINVTRKVFSTYNSNSSPIRISLRIQFVLYSKHRPSLCQWHTGMITRDFRFSGNWICKLIAWL